MPSMHVRPWLWARIVLLAPIVLSVFLTADVPKLHKMDCEQILQLFITYEKAVGNYALEQETAGLLPHSLWEE